MSRAKINALEVQLKKEGYRIEGGRLYTLKGKICIADFRYDAEVNNFCCGLLEIGDFCLDGIPNRTTEKYYNALSIYLQFKLLKRRLVALKTKNRGTILSFTTAGRNSFPSMYLEEALQKLPDEFVKATSLENVSSGNIVTLWAAKY